MEKNKIMMIIIIVLLVILLGTIAFVSIYAINLVTNNNQPITQQVNTTVKLSSEEITRVPAAPLTVSTNLTPSENGSTTHALKIDIQVEVNNNINNNKKLKAESDALIAQLTADDVVIKSIALKAIKSKTFEEVLQADMINILGDEITAALQEQYDTNLIIGVLISDFKHQ